MIAPKALLNAESAAPSPPMSVSARLPSSSTAPLLAVQRYLDIQPRFSVSKHTSIIQTTLRVDEGNAPLTLRIFINPSFFVISLSLSGTSPKANEDLIDRLTDLGWQAVAGPSPYVYRLLKPASLVQVASQLLRMLSSLNLTPDALIEAGETRFT